jgi:hypothetical protein
MSKAVGQVYASVNRSSADANLRVFALERQLRVAFRFCRNKVACYAVGDKTNNVIDEADHEPSCSARA